MCDFLPFEVNIKYNYVKINGIYTLTFTVIRYASDVSFLETLDKYYNIQEIKLSFNITRQNTAEILKKLTRIIATTGSEIFDSEKNKMDQNVLANIKNKAEILKKNIQVDGEQVYLISTYLSISADSEKELILKARSIVNKLYVNGIIIKPNNFKQKEGYITMLPLNIKETLLSKYTENICTETAVANLFPYFTRSVVAENGVVVGKANGSVCLIDLLDNKNMNYNMCVFGTSGAGKSYYIKLHILRNLYKGINQIIIDPEGEYVELVKFFNGTIYDKNTYNPFHISEYFVSKNEDFFNIKIKEIKEYVRQKYNVTLEDKLLEEYIQDIYSSYGITKDKKSLYITKDEDNIYIKPMFKTEFPSINELLEKLKIKCNDEVKDYSKTLSNLHLFHITGRTSKDIKKEIAMFLPKIYELIQENTLIYFDEIWKCISMGEDKSMLEEVYNMFKTLRKKKAGIIAISQDIGDLFNIDHGNFGKSILNNSHTKMFFRMEYADLEKLNDLNSELMANNVIGYERGMAYVKQGNTNYKLEVKASEYEHLIIERMKDYEENISSNGE